MKNQKMTAWPPLATRNEAAWFGEIEGYLDWRSELVGFKQEVPDTEVVTLMNDAVRRVCWKSYKRLSQQIFDLDVGEVLKYHLYQCERLQLRTLSNCWDKRKSYMWIRADDLVEQYPAIGAYRHSKNSLVVPLLADYYLPRSVMSAMQCLISLWYGWTLETVLAIRASDIRIETEGSLLLKFELPDGKCGEIHETEAARIRVFRLLLEHYHNGRQFNRLDSSEQLFCGFVGKLLQFQSLSVADMNTIFYSRTKAA